jgi:hypothetical protein
VARRIKSMKNSNYTIGNRSCDLPACSIVPQTLLYRYFYVVCDELFFRNFFIFVLSNLRTNFLAANHLVV